MATVGQTVPVPVKSAWTSKVNWAVALTSIGDILNEVLPLVPPKYQHEATLIISAIGGIAVIVIRTWFTNSVTAQSTGQ